MRFTDEDLSWITLNMLLSFCQPFLTPLYGLLLPLSFVCFSHVHLQPFKKLEINFVHIVTIE